MVPSDSESVITVGNSTHNPPFMRLPTEVREMVYRHLLIAKYTMREHNMNSKEFDVNRRYLQRSPDQSYVFHTAIIGTNRKIYEEARDLCRRENDLICLTSQRTSRLGYEVEERGLQMIARGAKAMGFWNVSMTLSLDPVALSGWPPCRSWFYEPIDDVEASESGKPWRYIFSREELPTFCRLLLKLYMNDASIIRNTALYIGINPAIWNGQATEIDSNASGLSRMTKLLEPLRQLHSFGAAQIEGPLSGSYKGDIIRSVCKDCPTAVDIINTAIAALNQSDEQVSKGHPSGARLGYKTALSCVRSCCWQYDERDFTLGSGTFLGLMAFQAMSNLKIRLQGRIAASYLASGMMRMARIYTERALDPRRPYDRRHNKMYSPLDIEPWEHEVYAEVLDLAAQIRYAQGNVWEAMGQLGEAGELRPLDEEQKSRYEAWQKRADWLQTRRANQQEARERQLRKQNENNEGRIRVVCNWKDKGDRLLQNGSSILAASTYQTALSKLEPLNQDRHLGFTIRSTIFEGYSAWDAVNALKFKLQASIAAAYLMSRKYEEVSRLIDAGLKCSHAHRGCTHDQSHDYCNHMYSNYGRPCWAEDPEHDWAEDQKLDYAKMHYCKAIALKHTGDAVGAIEHMEKALSFDPGDGTASAQLMLLKEKLKENGARSQRLKKLNSGQIQLRNKQIRRREKARA